MAKCIYSKSYFRYNLLAVVMVFLSLFFFMGVSEVSANSTANIKDINSSIVKLNESTTNHKFNSNKVNKFRNSYDTLTNVEVESAYPNMEKRYSSEEYIDAEMKNSIYLEDEVKIAESKEKVPTPYIFIRPSSDKEVGIGEIINYYIEVGNEPTENAEVWKNVVLTNTYNKDGLVLEIIPTSFWVWDDTLYENHFYEENSDKIIFKENSFDFLLGNIDIGEYKVIGYSAKVVGYKEDNSIKHSAIAKGYDSRGENIDSKEVMFEYTVKINDNPIESTEIGKESINKIYDGQPMILTTYSNRLNSTGIQTIPINSTVVYKIHFKFIGEPYSYVKGITISDVIDTNNLDILEDTFRLNDIPTNKVTYTNNKIVLTENYLQADVDYIFTFEAKIKENASEIIENQVTARIRNSKNEETEEISNVDKIYTGPILNINKSVSNEIVTLKEEFDYTIEYNNSENLGNAFNVTVTDKLPEYLTYVTNTTKINGISVDDNEVWKDNKFSYSIEEMKEKERGNISFKVYANKFPTNLLIENTAKISGEDEEGNKLKEKESTVINKITYNLAELQTEKTIFDSEGNNILNEEIEVDNIVTYNIRIKNPNENSVLKDIVLEDILSERGNIIEESLLVNGEKPSSDSFNLNDNSLTIHLEDLIGNNSHLISYNVTVLEGNEDYLINKITTNATSNEENLTDTKEIKNRIKDIVIDSEDSTELEEESTEEPTEETTEESTVDSSEDSSEEIITDTSESFPKEESEDSSNNEDNKKESIVKTGNQLISPQVTIIIGLSIISLIGYYIIKVKKDK